MIVIVINTVPLWQSASHLGFTNPLHVEVASIGTVPRTFALFLFYTEVACFRKVEGVLSVIYLALSVVSIYIINFCKFVFQRSKVALVCFFRDVPLQSPHQVIYYTQFGKFSARRDSTHESGGIVSLTLHLQCFFQSILKAVKCVALAFARIKGIMSIGQVVESGKQFIFKFFRGVWKSVRGGYPHLCGVRKEKK